jgi:S-ribosylhomocysteine lyase
MIEMYEFIRDFSGDIPGATAENCGNYSDMNLDIAKFYAKQFLDDVLYQIDEEHLNYPA